MITIRQATPNDAEALSQIAIAAKRHWDYPGRWMEIWIPQLTFSPSYFVENESWVAERSGMPIAFHTLQDREGTAWLENMWVSPEHMGEGVGRKLFLHAVNLARQRGHRTLQLEADPNARRFYEKMGMRKIGAHQ
jgi:GNAT superfamily N-acetyltransferase